MNAYDTLVSRAQRAPIVPGSTSYFSAPETHLDPALFNTRTNTVLPNIRTNIISTLYHFWETKYRNTQHWSRVWIAGSGASYQWSAARSPGDLDVLIGVDYYEFRSSNPEYKGLSDAEISDNMDDEFRNELDPRTANTVLNGTPYEVTFYVNVESADIRNIMPYAAYDLSNNVWSVHPDVNPVAPSTVEFRKSAREDKSKAKEILKEYERNLKSVHKAKDDATRLNSESWLKRSVEEGANLFDEIHLGRHAAFKPGGLGYADYANYRWQAGKQNGIVPALQQLKAIKKNSMDDTERILYGAPIMDTEHALIKALLWKAGQ